MLLRQFPFPALVLSVTLATLLVNDVLAEEPSRPGVISGIYPHLAMFNSDGECGTGAVVPWGDHLWVVTYSPHRPRGSDDKLYEITSDLKQIIRPESIGGTPANRMIHSESQQLFIGPYAISREGQVRTIPYSRMFGRPTGNARHLFDPANKIYCASMEEALYEIDVHTLEVKELWADEAHKEGRHSQLPGYHGKGLSSGYGRVIYANNGEHGQPAQIDPETPSGVLAEWDGMADAWTIVSRNQFTEITTPDGIQGNLHPESNPVWALGWDNRSLILMCLSEGKWSRYRLVKSSHSYDGAHGWNTEWPRIREIGETDLLMTMHGAFWKFPPGFRPSQTQGIRQRSSYLKIVGDFCRWGDRIVLGCDDSAKNEFLNKRKAKGELAGPAQSQSNLRFLNPQELDEMGPTGGRGAVWLHDPVTAGTASDPMHVGGFDECIVFLQHDQKVPVQFQVEADTTGSGTFQAITDFPVPVGKGVWKTISLEKTPEWIRLVPDRSCPSATALFTLRNTKQPPSLDAKRMASLATPDQPNLRGGLVRAGTKETGLQLLAHSGSSEHLSRQGYYILTPELTLVPSSDRKAETFLKEKVAVQKHVVEVTGNSLLFIDDDGQRYRLPIGNSWFLDHPDGVNHQRIAREVCTERDLFQAAGTFYELPARNAGGFPKIRPVCTHDRFIHDYCTWRGLLVLSGLQSHSDKNDPHVIESADGLAAVWLGCVDDLWKFGKPRGTGSPWHQANVIAGDVSDPFLLSGFDRKTLTAETSGPVQIDLECDLLGTGVWTSVGQLDITLQDKQTVVAIRLNGESQPGTATMPTTRLELPTVLNSAAWIRFRARNNATITLTLQYE